MGEIKKVYDCVVNMNEDGIVGAVEAAVKQGYSAKEIYEKGLSNGILKVTELFERKEYYIPEVIVCADTLKKGINHLDSIGGGKSEKGPKVILAVVEGDHHEIGKNIVKIIMEAANFQVIDLGLNVKAEEVVRRAIEEEADAIGLSTMMTTTMASMEEVVDLLGKENSINGKVPKVIIGGGCISQKYADEIACDGYAQNAVEGVKLMQELIGDGKN